MTFEIKRGTNISHWLSQRDPKYWKERATFFTEQDIERIKGYGFDHIRLPIDEEQLWDEQGKPREDAFQMLDWALNTCKKEDIRAIVDLHRIRSHEPLPGTKERNLFTDPKEQERLVNYWIDLSGRLQKHPVSHVAYEIMNEPVALRAEDWNRVAHATYNAIRKREPARTIVLGSNYFNSPNTFDQLKIPQDKNCILTFHFYNPHFLTHYKAPWVKPGEKMYEGPVHYPGKILADEDYKKLDAPERERYARFNAPYGREQMEADLHKPLDIQSKTGLKLYCGEFGCYRTVPEDVRRAWYTDIIKTFSKYNIAWANWDYKGGFGILKEGKEDYSVLNPLLGKN